MTTSLSVHQHATGGKLKLTDLIDPILGLRIPAGEEPSLNVPNHKPYLTTTVGGLLESTCKINADYEKADELIANAAGKEGQVPATHDQIASWIITQPPATQIGPNDGGIILAAEVVKRIRDVKNMRKHSSPGSSRR